MQGFRFADPVTKNNKITIKGWHLSYDAKKYVIKDAYAVEKNCNGALEHFNSNTDSPSPFSTISDILSVCSTRVVRKSLFEVYEWLLSSDKYGGHWYRDNWTLGITSKIGQDRGVVISAGKNLTGFQSKEDWEQVCTKILPYTTDGDTVVMLEDTYIEIEEKLYDIPYTKVVSFDNDLNAESYVSKEEYHSAIRNWLKGQAITYLDKNKLPKVNYSVSANINNVSDVGDVIQVKHPRCKINILTEVISVKYDAIRKKYIKIEFGNFKKELKNLSQNISAEIEKKTENTVKESQAFLHSELEEATARINGVLGNSYVIIEGDKLLAVDTLPKEKAVNVLKISNGGIGFSQTGIKGPFTSAWTLDGTLNMQNINVINLTASMIKGGILKLGGKNNTSGVFELYNEQNSLIARMDKEGLTVFAKNGDYVKLNAEEGFCGYDSHGTKSYWADGETFHMMNAEIERQITIAGMIKIVPVSTAESKGVGFVALS
ncbi:MAG: hypothetical protein E7593_03960 [Ruminococcaceae bacterium]|nr:hypothetical protein [Oscillospiraceae bacterium]